MALRHVEPNGPRPGGSGRRQARAACGTVRRRLAAGLRAEALEAAPEDLWRRFWPGQASGSFAGALRSARDPIPQERAAFVSWAVLGAPFGNLPPAVPAAPTPVGEAPRMLDIFLRVGRCGGGTPEGLLACRDARACQVLRTDPGRTAWLRDGFTDETFEVRFGAFSRRARAGDVEGVWLRPLAGVFDVCGLGWTLPPPDLEPQRRFGERHLERLRQVDPGLGWRAGRCREGSPRSAHDDGRAGGPVHRRVAGHRPGGGGGPERLRGPQRRRRILDLVAPARRSALGQSHRPRPGGRGDAGAPAARGADTLGWLEAVRPEGARRAIPGCV